MLCFDSFFGQMIPGHEENIPFLVTFGGNHKTEDGDDDHKQAFFILIPESFHSNFYIRIFDPETGGQNDEKIGVFDSKTEFSMFAGAGVHSSVKGQNANSKSEVATGHLLEKISFGSDLTYDNKWYSFGPFNPAEGEYSKEQKAYLFKILAVGLVGNDGNAYNYFISKEPLKNSAIAGANAFTYEYAVRLHESKTEISHLYPFVDESVIALKQHNFDLDNVCDLSVYSIKKIAEKGKCSGNNIWSESTHKIVKEERQSCMDFQFINNKNGYTKNNNIVLYITNQYGEFLPFMSAPIGNFNPKRTIGIR
jgi:hypothetical protein